MEEREGRGDRGKETSQNSGSSWSSWEGHLIRWSQTSTSHLSLSLGIVDILAKIHPLVCSFTHKIYPRVLYARLLKDMAKWDRHCDSCPLRGEAGPSSPLLTLHHNLVLCSHLSSQLERSLAFYMEGRLQGQLSGWKV